MKTTKISFKEDRATAISSTAYGANLDTMGFNISYLAKNNPKLVAKIIAIYEEALQTK